MKELTLDNGVQSYVINGCEVRFNPTDINFAGRLMKLLNDLDALESERQEKSKDCDAMQAFELAQQYDSTIRERLDAALGAPISAAVAGDVSIYAVTDGLPIFSAIVVLLWEQIDRGVANATRQQNPRLEALLKKYRKA